MLKKRVSVSQKRQITIPVEFYNSLGIEKEVECYVQNKSNCGNERNRFRKV